MQWCFDQNPTLSYVMDHRDWPGKQWQAECQARRCTRLTSVLFANSQAFLKAYFIFILFFKCILSFSNSTLLNMSYFLKIADLSPILWTKCLSTTALYYSNYITCKLRCLGRFFDMGFLRPHCMSNLCGWLSLPHKFKGNKSRCVSEVKRRIALAKSAFSKLEKSLETGH